MKALKPKSERNIILLCVVIAVLVPTLTYFYLSATRLKTQSRTDSKKNSPDTQETSLEINNAPLPQVKTEPIIISGACIFKPVKSLTQAEHQFVLDSARKKLISVLKNEDSIFYPWMTLYTKPMTTTELEVLGDYILKQKVANQGGVVPSALKIEVYWNRRVGETSMAAGMHHGSLFYNSCWDIGERGGLGVENPKSFDDMGLYNYLLKNGLSWGWAKPLEYDTKNQVLYFELPVKSMTELIFCTFQVLDNGLRSCLFDRLPNLQQVTIIYKDSEGNEIGYGNYDIHYWQSLMLSPPFPFEVENDYSDKLFQLDLKYKSKLITEDEYYTQLKYLRDVYNEQKLQYYQGKWLKLFPLVTNKDFQLNKQLPLTHKDFRF
jgi:hypothetical protein